jgi:hypothetical protein
MEETATSGGGGGIPWLWGVASAAQMGLGVRSYIKGHAGDSCLMPLKAFSVASLFIGSAASASIFILQTNGIYGVILSFKFLRFYYCNFCFMLSCYFLQ